MKQPILSNKLNTLSKFFDLEQISQKSVSTEKISNYYKINKFAYWLFNSRKGYVHMGISKSGKYKKSDLEVVLNEVGNHLKDTSSFSVLELAAGKGANSLYLARKYKEVNFCGLDLPIGQTDTAINKAAQVGNFQMQRGDFHNLSIFEDQSFDVVFVIEALCHSTNKVVVAREVNRVLKQGGVFFIADGYLRKQDHSLTNEELLTQKLLAKGMMVEEFEIYDNVRDKIVSGGFDLLSEEDVTQFVIPTAQKFEKLACMFLSLGLLAKIFLKIFPNDFSHNIVSGYLFPDMLRANLGCYYLSIFKRK